MEQKIPSQIPGYFCIAKKLRNAPVIEKIGQILSLSHLHYTQEKSRLYLLGSATEK